MERHFFESIDAQNLENRVKTEIDFKLLFHGRRQDINAHGDPDNLEAWLTHTNQASVRTCLLSACIVNGGVKVYQRGGAKVYQLAQGNGPRD